MIHIMALVFMLAFCAGACWLNWQKGKVDSEIEVIQGKREPLVKPCGWEY